MKRGKRIQILIEDYEDYYTTFSEDLSPSIFSDPKYYRNRDRLIYIGVDCCCPIHSSHPRIVTAAFVGGSSVALHFKGFQGTSKLFFLN